jgi:hypothetical protein
MFGGQARANLVLTPTPTCERRRREHPMHAVIVTFRPAEMSQEAFRELAGEVAPAFADIPGLVTKIWLDAEDPSTPSGGGIYLFEDETQAAAYLTSELFRSGVAENPHLADVSWRAVPVLEGPTRTTSPGLRAVAV